MLCVKEGHDMSKGKNEMTINELLSAISESEYPEYIMEAISRVRNWMKEMTENEDNNNEDVFSSIFGDNFEEGSGGIDTLFERLQDLGEYADLIPNAKAPEGKSDALIVSIAPPDYESGLRTAIDYAAVFNRSTCKRVWIISDTFIFDDIIKFSPHVDALAEQGITLRYILVTPWGWVELPLSGMSASKRSFLWRNDEITDEGVNPRKEKS